MSMQDPLADMLTRIRNSPDGFEKSSVSMPSAKLGAWLSPKLLKEKVT